jgi:hypothetical protein
MKACEAADLSFRTVIYKIACFDCIAYREAVRRDIAGSRLLGIAPLQDHDERNPNDG